MPTAGELLRDERLKRNRTLSDIAAQTCISKRYLEAIEVDRLKDLPGEFFYRSFIRQYAKALELDGPSTQRILSAAVVGESDPDPLPALNFAYENSEPARAKRWSAPTGVAIGLLLLVIALCSLLYAVWQRFQARSEPEQQQTAQTQPVQPPSEQQAPAPQPTPAPAEQQAGGVAAPAEQAAPAAAAPPAAAPTATPSAPGRMSVTLSATEPAWVSLTSDGKPLFVGTLDAASPRQFDVGDGAKLVTGNAGGVQVQVNGSPLGQVGPRGQVRTIIFSGGQGQVVAPRPKTPPADAAPAPTQ